MSDRQLETIFAAMNEEEDLMKQRVVEKPDFPFEEADVVAVTDGPYKGFSGQVGAQRPFAGSTGAATSSTGAASICADDCELRTALRAEYPAARQSKRAQRLSRWLGTTCARMVEHGA